MGKRGRHVQAERALARDTPDELEQVFDLERETFRSEYQQWVRRYQKLMRIKHGADVVVKSKHSSVTGLPSVRLITVYVEKPAA